jgi:(p)ppGpp synthase/HD superfamily hydrolase
LGCARRKNCLLPRYNFNELDELLAAIGGGDIRLNQMVNFLQAQFNQPSAEEQDAAALRQLQQKTLCASGPEPGARDGGRVVVEGRRQSDAPHRPLLPADSG